MSKKSSWGFDTAFIDRSVRPQDDFYHYAVGTWIKGAAIPAHESRWGSFHILRHTTDQNLKKLLVELEQTKRVAPGSPEQMIRDMYRSGMDMKRRNALGTKPLEPLRALVSGINTNEDAQRVIARLHRLGVGVLWGSGIDQDFTNTDRYQLFLFQSGLGLPDRDYYLKNGEEQVRVRTAYETHMKRLLMLVGYPEADAEYSVSRVINIETTLAKASMPKEDLRDPLKLHHPHSFAQLKKLAPSIDWNGYLKAQGVAEIKKLNVMQPDFITSAEKLLSTTSIEDLKRYLDWHVISDFSGLLGERFVRANFDFYGRVLSGTTKMKPLWRRVLGSVNGVVGELVGQVYVKRYFSPEAKQKVNAIVDDLFVAYEARIKALDWMSPATKKKALVKLRAMGRKLAYPDKWRSYKGLVIKDDDYFGNILRATEFEHKRAVRKLSKPVDRTEWYDYPQTVNAFYSPSMNDMLFPAAILQHPFFNYSADDAVNYGAMGMVIGHEMTHGFDNDGAKFDFKGNVKNWWTADDKKRFEVKARLVEKQFNEYTVAGLPVNGKLTLGENIADLGGVAIAYDAYQMQLARTGRREIDGFTPEQRFFLAYAQSEQELSRPEAQKLQILTDPHAPSVTRVNGPLSNMDAFYEAWGVKKGDKLYREPKKRAKIW